MSVLHKKGNWIRRSLKHNYGTKNQLNILETLLNSGWLSMKLFKFYNYKLV